MKRIFAVLLTAIIAIPLISCSGKAKVTDVKATLTPENSVILEEADSSFFIEVKATYDETVKFYEKAVESLGAKGELTDFDALYKDAPEDIAPSGKTWAYTGTYGDDNLLSITVADSDDENSCTVSVHFKENFQAYSNIELFTEKSVALQQSTFFGLYDKIKIVKYLYDTTAYINSSINHEQWYAEKSDYWNAYYAA